MSGSAPPSGNPPTWARAGPIRARASPTGPARSRSRACGAWRRATAASMPACSRPGCSAATTAARRLAACRGAAEASVAAAMEPRRRRPHPAFAGPASGGQGPDLGRHLGRRRLPHRRRRRDLGAAQPRHARRFPARRPELSGVRPVRAQSGDGARHARPALPAEPLRHVPQRRWRQELAEHRERPALELRLPGGGASARSRHRSS